MAKDALNISPSLSKDYLDPRREPCKWLGETFLDLLNQDTEEAKKALEWALPRIANWLEPGLIDQLFGDWIDQYLDLLSKHENNQNSSDERCLLKDPQEQPE